MRKLDYLQLTVMLALLAVGCVFIRSIGEQIGTVAAQDYFPRQLIWIAVGTAAYFCCAVMDYRKLHWRLAALAVYVLCILLLGAVLIWGKEINGANRWLVFGQLRLQPSEPAQFAIIAVVAGLFASSAWYLKRGKIFLISAAVTGVPFLLIVKEPDLGSAMMLMPIYFSLLFAAGLRWRYIIAVLIGLIVLAGFGYYDCQRENPLLLRGYQRDRIRVFLDPSSDIKNRGHNAYQARLAVGSGGFYGKGLGKGTQNELGFLPQMGAHNDFIFSVIAEESGFSGVLGLLIAYGLLLYSMLRTAFFAPPYGRLLTVGIATMFFFHIFINVGMSVGVAPVTGLSLPLVSYGGSSIVTTMAALGLLQSIRIH